MYKPAITGTGVFTPDQVITNAELVNAFNAYVDLFNTENAEAIATQEIAALEYSSEEFIFKASGIEQRYVLDKTGILDPKVMHPLLRQRDDDEPGQMAEMALDAAHKALEAAGKTPSEVDAVICAASNLERAYPAVAIEIQKLLGINGFAFDMNVACSSATFGIQAAADMVRSGSIRSALVVNPEICSAHLEWRDRDCHFIFGDVATAILIEREENAAGPCFEIKSTRCATDFCAAPGLMVWPTGATCNSCRTAAKCSRKSCRWSPPISPVTCRTKTSKLLISNVFGCIRRTSR